MAKRREDDALCPSRAWVWTADAERRWLRAFRLLLTPGGPAQDARRQEVRDEGDRGSVGTGLDGGTGGAQVNCAAPHRPARPRRRGAHSQPRPAGAPLRLPGLAAGGIRAGRRRGRLPRPAAARRPQDALPVPIRGAVAEVRADGRCRPAMQRAAGGAPGRVPRALAPPALWLPGRPVRAARPGQPDHRRGVRVGRPPDLRVVRRGRAAPPGDHPVAVSRRDADAAGARAVGAVERRGNLHNRAYQGVAYGNRPERVPSRRRIPRSGRLATRPGGQSTRARPADTGIAVPIPAIITPEVLATQERLARHQAWALCRIREEASCAAWPAAAAAAGRRACAITGATPTTAARRARPCRGQTLPNAAPDAAVWAELCPVLSDPAVLAEAMRRA